MSMRRIATNHVPSRLRRTQLPRPRAFHHTPQIQKARTNRFNTVERATRGILNHGALLPLCSRNHSTMQTTSSSLIDEKNQQLRQKVSSSDDDSTASPNIYKIYARPFAKVFLTGMFTFQVLYWGWESLRTQEIRREKLAEIRALEVEAEEYTQSRSKP